MKQRDYYSKRTGKITVTTEITLDVLKKLFLNSYEKMLEEGYFQKYFGYCCTDGDVKGELGNNIDAMIFRFLKKDSLWPLKTRIVGWI